MLIVVIVVLTHNDNSTPSATPATTTEASTYPTDSEAIAQPAPPSSEAPPSTSAGIAGLAPFVREWRGARESIVIDAAGNGHFHYMMDCPSCTSMADIPYNTMDFKLTSVSGDTASGTVTVSSDPQFSVGEPVAVRLGELDTIHWSVGGKEEGLFCGSNPSWCGG
ncbi:hypothetical protein A5707_14020 [Mycobacterium kyorinense]|uniref:Uncharacterized protein n=1 Tax=Mycobacterium kyorinense TaxID=487514 RepID=A0A1A2ZKU3_9MYCO|nr:hypothetical protein [Mycobacterium kyorinense]OBI51209.1 hypothetical protein A5707_14020 [Mycobacterium kyorinense]